MPIVAVDVHESESSAVAEIQSDVSDEESSAVAESEVDNCLDGDVGDGGAASPAVLESEVDYSADGESSGDGGPADGDSPVGADRGSGEGTVAVAASSDEEASSSSGGEGRSAEGADFEPRPPLIATGTARRQES